MKKCEKIGFSFSVLMLFFLLICIFLTKNNSVLGKTEYYEVQKKAVNQLSDCFFSVRKYKEELGISMREEDIHQTGMIGQSYSGITTTLGALEAKRTAAWPDMAALCVKMLYEAGIKPGDTVGAGFSGSFPGMNLAVIAACESLNVNLVCISSVGASTYGANDPTLTFPDMMFRLEKDGVIRTKNVAITMGGNDDIGTDMDQELLEQIRQRFQKNGLPLVELEEYQENLLFRKQLYQEYGPIRCFIAVGGNVTSMGTGEGALSLGQGVLFPKLKEINLDNSSGLVQYYLAQGVPVIHLLNLKQIMADYSMPFDPVNWPEEGVSAVYFTIQYDRTWIIIGFVGTIILLAMCALCRKKQAGLNYLLEMGKLKNGRTKVENFDDR